MATSLTKRSIYNLSAMSCLLSSLIVTSQAKSSQWGCEVLLCVSNPAGWQSVAACHPPMTKLIAAMKAPGFSWPTCPEAGTGAPGYVEFEDCPDGWKPAYFVTDAARSTGDMSLCQSLTPVITRSAEGGQELTYPTMPRPRREQPWFFDISNQDSSTAKTRHWFNLNR